MKHFLSTLVLCVALPAAVFAQAEHVPVHNFVYKFLDRMQRNGIATSYSRAVLPLERKEVTALIDTVYTRRSGLSSSEAALAERFYDEFVREANGTQTPAVLLDGNGSISENLFNDNEKFLLTMATDDRQTTLFAEFLFSAEYRGLMSAERTANVNIGNVGGRFRGTVAGIIGFGLTSTNGTSFGDRSLALEDRRLRQNFNYTQYNEDYFDFTEAYVSGIWDWGNLSLGKELTLFGNSPYFPTLVSENPPAFDAVKLNVMFGDFRFSFMHGFLLSERSFTDERKPFFEPKYIAVHRAEFAIMDSWRVGVFESVIYSERGIDAAYMNPVNFYKSAEHAGGDRDNPMLGFDTQLLPFNGLELYGSWTLDDVDFSRWGTNWWGNKFIWQGGVITSALIPDMDFGMEYTRIEPYLYTHFFANTTYTNNGYVIGADLPPNSDQWFASLTWWLGASLQVRGTLQIRRHGGNVYDADGNIVKNNGGDPAFTNDYSRDSQFAPFLEGIRTNERIAGLHVRYEPLRNYIIEGRYLLAHIEREAVDDEAVASTRHLATLILRIEF